MAFRRADLIVAICHLLGVRARIGAFEDINAVRTARLGV